ncbi:hypothetical protein [Pseudoponticoccus marisrubri]|uniref:Ferrochelatase n=1 Tax=Pseudoponticoccus marisrubri TaxID=1685382 RepID=A0A0W7WFN9_9RHOB|nr:hypothetical protein [Pseudoponticoccus marisrubri]KUF09294.1 hypothetical protein AVJ23_18765 [Pseudoponticoccus marisrubri]
MKRITAAALAATLFAATPALAQEAPSTNDPFVSTAGAGIPALAVIGGMAVVIAIASASGTD